MKDRIRRIARGQIDEEMPRLEFSQSKIDAVIPYGSSYQGDIQIKSTNRVSFRGLIYTGDSRVILKHRYFAGESTVLTYEASGRRLEPGEEITGAFLLVCTAGEYTIPYRFVAGVPGGMRYGQMKTLGDFAVFARQDPDQALRLFGSQEFPRLPFMRDLKLQALHDGLRRSGSQRSAMEEFLTASGAKEPQILEMDTGQRRYLFSGKELSDQFTLRRTGWGYTAVRITADAPFLALSRSLLTDSDFVGNSASVEYRIYPGKLHAGRNFGRIIAEGTNFRAEFPILVTREEKDTERRTREANTGYERLFVRFLRIYLDVLAEKGDPERQGRELGDLWEEMAAIAIPDIRRRIWQAEIYRLSGRRGRAVRLLKSLSREAEQLTDDTEAYCCYRYLKMLLEESWEEKEEFLALVTSLEDAGKAGTLARLLKLRAADMAASQPQAALDILQGMYRQGVRSPFLYLEACRIYERYPDILRHIGAFELQVLWFGNRHGYLSREVLLAAAAMAAEETSFRPAFFRLLADAYRREPNKVVLTAICQLLIRGDIRTPESFTWYAEGVAKDVSLTRLYDYYLYALPEDFAEELPSSVLLYYSYNSPADIRSRELLYGNVLEHFSRDSRIWQAYEKQMQDFTREQILQGRVSPSLAGLYRRMLFPDVIDSRLSRYLPDILKSCVIRVSDPLVRSVIVVYGELTGEKVYPLQDQEAVIPLYSESCRVLFADQANVRYATLPYEAEPLFTAEETAPLLERCIRNDPDLPMLRLMTANACLKSGRLGAAGLRAVRAQLESGDLRAVYQSILVSAVIHFFPIEEPEHEEELLACMQSRNISREDRLFLTEALIEKDYLDEAMSLVRSHGYTGLSLRSLRTLVSGKISGRQAFDPGREDLFLTELAYFVFRAGQADDTILTWLCRTFNGLSTQMLEILRQSVSRGTPRSDLAERLLGQMIFTRTYEALDEVFRCYVEDGPADEMLVQAYFVLKSYAYFVLEEKPDEDIIGHIGERVRNEHPHRAAPAVMRLALLKYYAGQPSLPQDDARLAAVLVEDFCREGIIFRFYQDLSRMITVPDEICDKTIIEYRGDREDEPELVYRILTHEEEGAYSAVPMLHSFEGIFVRPVLLFEGETMDYEIQILENGLRVTAERGRTGPVNGTGTGANRYRRLNHILKEMEADTEGWQEEAEGYAERATLGEKLFDLR